MLSVVTVELRDFASVMKTSKSLEILDLDYEQIVVVSDMNLFNRLRKLGTVYPKMNVFFVPAEGVYPAMNAGVSKAKHQWLMFLNAGDELLDKLEFLSSVDADQYEIIFGRFRNQDKLFSIKSDWYTRVGMPTSHQAMIFSAKRFVGYSKQYKLSSDFAYIVQKIIQDVNILKVDNIIALNEPHGLSDNKALILREYSKIIRENYGLLYVPLIYLRICMQLINRRLKSK